MADEGLRTQLANMQADHNHALHVCVILAHACHSWLILSLIQTLRGQYINAVEAIKRDVLQYLEQSRQRFDEHCQRQVWECSGWLDT